MKRIPWLITVGDREEDEPAQRVLLRLTQAGWVFHHWRMISLFKSRYTILVLRSEKRWKTWQDKR